MKKSLLALAVLGAFAGVAQAESSVTLFGIVDLAAQRVSNDGVTTSKLAADGNATSRLGFRGVEDLAPGLQAGFWLEGQLGPDTGSAGSSTAGQFFNRRATVSLTSASLGEVRLGRDYVPTFWNNTVYDPFGTNGVGNHNNVMNAVGSYNSSAGKTSTFVRANNSLGYFLPKLSGFLAPVSGQFMYAMPEGDSSASNKYLGARLVYANGPLSLSWSGATIELNKPGQMDKDEKVINLAGSYTFANKAVVMAQFNRYTLIDYSTFTNDNKLQNFLVGMTYPVGAVTLKASYNSSTTRTVSPTTVVAGTVQYSNDLSKYTTLTDAGAKQLAIGAVYDLSKRTATYFTYSELKNADHGTATVNGSSIAAGKKSSGFEVGVRHSF